jgi:uncharacterized protein (DUF4213/DUF364 family)
VNPLHDAYVQIMQLYKAWGLTPECISEICFSGKWTAVFGTGIQSGMAFTFTGEHDFYGEVDSMQFAKLQPFRGKRLTYLAEYLEEKADVFYFKALYLAVLNALSNPLNSEGMLKKRGFSFVQKNEFDFVRKDDFVTVVGAGGVVNKLRQYCKEVHISDMRPKSSLESLLIGEEILKGPERIVFHGPEENELLLAQSDIVFMTGCTLVNQTFFDLIPMIKKARIIGMFGPSSMLLPDFLFSLGVNYITTSRITKPKLMQDYLFDGFCGKKFEECMDNYAIVI